MKLALVEPLRELFKDEVRALGAEIGLPHHVLWRQPFPGPGLAVRVLGEVTRARCDVLRQGQHIVGTLAQWWHRDDRRDETGQRCRDVRESLRRHSEGH